MFRGKTFQLTLPGNSYRIFIEGLKSPVTKAAYCFALQKYMKHLNINNPDDLLIHQGNPKIIQNQIIEYPIQLKNPPHSLGINLTAPSFIMIDLDLKDFDQSQEKLDKTLRKTLNKISKVLHGAQPTVLWTGGGYHIYQPIRGFILEEIDRFAYYKDPTKKDLTSRFMQFAKDYFTEKKSDPQHRPSVRSCLIRIPGTINSKYKQEIRIVQGWDGFKPAIQYLLRDFRTWLVSEKINDKLEEKRSLRYRNLKNTNYNWTNTISWIEKLLQMPIEDHRKYALWRIVFPYLFNVRKMSDYEVVGIVRTWLDKCAKLRPLDFNSDYLLRQNIRNSEKNHYLPISIHKLSIDNPEFYDIVSQMARLITITSV